VLACGLDECAPVPIVPHVTRKRCHPGELADSLFQRAPVAGIDNDAPAALGKAPNERQSESAGCARHDRSLVASVKPTSHAAFPVGGASAMTRS